MEEAIGWQSMWRKDKFKVRELNDRLMMAERAFTDQDGLPGRPWYKHLVCIHKQTMNCFPVVFPTIVCKQLNWYTIFRFMLPQSITTMGQHPSLE